MRIYNTIIESENLIFIYWTNIICFLPHFYLEIEKIRFEDKFDFTEELSEECLESEVPNMLLQPLFENAIKHAVYESLDKVKVNLKCQGENGYLKIEVSNTFDPDIKTKKGAGVGLKNISERLNLIYHQNNLIQVNKENGVFRVVLFIPQADASV